MCDADELQAAMRNLLENAVKYSRDHINVLVTLSNEGTGRVQFRVSDDGVGILPSETKRIFKRFYRISSPVSLRVKGTGLGLYIVANVAKRHGGRVFAESEGPGRGSIFTLDLPVASVGVAEPEVVADLTQQGHSPSATDAPEGSGDSTNKVGAPQ